MIKASSSNPLKKTLEEHLKVTERQVKRLDQIFQGMGCTSAAEAMRRHEGVN